MNRTSSDINNILNSLSSTKVKERTAAIDELVSILKQRPQDIPTPLLASTSHTLIELLDLEHRKYCRYVSDVNESNASKISLSETKITNISYVVRLFIEKTCQRFKVKTMNQLLTILPELMINDEGSFEIIKPIAFQLSMATYALIQSDLFQLKFTSHRWSSLIEKTCSYIEKYISVSLTDRTILSLFSILDILLSLDCMALQTDCMDIYRALLSYLEACTKENGNTRLIFLCINKLIVKTHCIKIHEVLDLINATWRYIISIGNISNDAINTEMSFFDIISSELACNKLPTMLGQKPLDIESSLLRFEDYLNHRISNFASKSFTLDSLMFDESFIEQDKERISWFETHDFQLKDSAQHLPWLRLHGITKLLASYFELKKPYQSVNLFKRRKCEDNTVYILKNSDDIFSFIERCLDNTQPINLQIFGLQICAMYGASFSITANQIERLLTVILSKFAVTELIGFSALSLIPLVSQKDFTLSEADLNTILKVGLPLLKNPESSIVICVLLARLIHYNDLKISDTKTINLIYDIYELSTINGPKYMCNESFFFGRCLQKYGKHYHSRSGKSSASKVLKWVYANWDQIKDIDIITQNEFSIFMAWFCCRDTKGVKGDNKWRKYGWMSCSWQENYYFWNLFQEQRQFLLQDSENFKCVRLSKTQAQEGCTYENIEVSEILYRILDLIENNDNLTSLQRFNWLHVTLGIVSYLSGDSNFTEFIMAFKSTVALSVSSIKFIETKSYTRFFEAILSVNNPNVAHLLYEELDIIAIVTEFKKSKLASAYNLLPESISSEFDGFEKSQKLKDEDIRLYAYTIPYNQADIKLAADALISTQKLTNQTKCLDIIYNFMADLPPYMLIQCLPSINGLLTRLSPGLSIGTECFESLTHLIGERLLGGRYNTYNGSMEMLCDYLDALRLQWLGDNKSPLNADCNDILDWIISRFEENSFPGGFPTGRLSILLLNILKFNSSTHSSIKGGKQKIFATFTACLQRLGPAINITQLPAITSYMELVGYKNLSIILSELTNVYETPQQSIEMSAIYSLAMSKIGTVSYTTLIYTLEDLLSYSKFSHTRCYISGALQIITKAMGLKDVQALFERCKFDLFLFWCNKSGAEMASEIDWDIELFGFHDLIPFIGRYSCELSAIYFSQGLNIPVLLTKLVEITKSNESQLLTQSIHLSIPLSFAPNGVKAVIFDVIDNLLGRSVNKIMKQYELIIFRWILKFIDLGSSADMESLLRKTFPKSSLLYTLFPKNATSYRYQYPLHIELTTGTKLLKHRFRDFSRQHLRVLLFWILADLESSKNYIGKLHYIRELKYIFVIYENCLPTDSALLVIMKHISPYLIESGLHDETASIIETLLLFATKIDIHIYDVFPTLFSSLFMYVNQSHGDIHASLLITLESLVKNSSTFGRIWKYCMDVLQGLTLSNEVYQHVEILDQSEVDEQVLILLSLLFGFATPLNHFPEDYTVTESCIQNLLTKQIPEKYMSTNFKLWMSLCLELSYIRGYAPFKSIVLKKDIYSPAFFQEKNPLSLVYEQFFRLFSELTEKGSCKMLFLSEYILSFLVSSHSELSTTGSAISVDLYEKYKDRGLPVSIDSFRSVYRLENRGSGFDDYLTEHLISKTDNYETWLLKLSMALLNNITFTQPFLIIFQPLFKENIKFSENLLPYLVYLPMRDGQKDIREWATEILSKSAQILDTEDGEKKVKVVFNILRLIRCASRLSIDYFTHLYNSLDLHMLCDVALKADLTSFSYMLYEELYANSPKKDILILRNIYEKIDDLNLLSGLPVPDCLSASIDYINSTEPRTWKNFLFNSARIDSNYKKISAADRNAIMNSSGSNGIYFVANGLTEKNSDETSNEEYKWSLQLGAWDLPFPEQVNTKEKGLYYCLKKLVHEPTASNKSLEHSLLTVIEWRNHFRTQMEWYETVAEVSLFKKFVKLVTLPSELLYFFKTLHSIDDRKLTSTDFEDYKTNLNARYLLPTLISTCKENNIIPPGQMEVISAIHLSNFVEQALTYNASQDALRNSFLLNNIAEEMKNQGEKADLNAKIAIETLNSYISAKAMWSSNEVNAPIKIMQNLLQPGETTNDAEAGAVGLLSLITISKDQIISHLVTWSSQMRLETPSTIYKRYIDRWAVSLKENSARADIFMALANFLNEQVKRSQDSGEIPEKTRIYNSGISHLQMLDKIYKNASLSDKERKDARRHYFKINVQVLRDKELMMNAVNERITFLWMALHFYINTLAFSDKHDDTAMDKFCALWFGNDEENEINIRLQKEIGAIPSWKFLPWINQISSKLSTNQTPFQNVLQLTMKRLLYKLPYDTLYSVISIKLYDKNSQEQSIVSRITAVETILNDLKAYESGKYYRKFVMPIEEFCVKSVELANYKTTQNSRTLHLSNLKIGDYWCNILRDTMLPLPTGNFPITCSKDGRKARPYITAIDETVHSTTTGLSLPKIIKFTVSDGTVHKVLMKGSNDDLRQDSIMEQVFQQVNKILRQNKGLRKMELGIRTYKVIPLGPRAGIIEFVPNSISLHEVLSNLHKDDPIRFEQARKEMKAVQNKSNDERIKVYLKLTEKIKPQLRNFFFNSFLEPSAWFRSKQRYSKGAAASSIVGHILGLGDRHLNNILLDRSTGEPIHIDLGISFDQGRLLPIPELVPFRLTRDMVDGLGVTGVDGLFRRSCEKVYSVLRKDSEKVMCVLNILKWDPLYSWVMSPVRKHINLLEQESAHYGADKPTTSGVVSLHDGENGESTRALKGVEDKLTRSGLSVEATVQELIQQATDPAHLAVIYMGWSPFY
ncbi:DNA-binding protein kinase TEL1 NDAI_0E04020 [Naumovozyma dairenensis CBS 421]|uniref:Serine/threonine-protein kinase Tel1 n=1 Tax=Naumovozyma dairenensis (strain ATCC 10597 / BCRC 20456 / CBS 421 / NBRC 0211 / NRRL Y-12639) TaxID=1071378 RepID=G0WBU9_NAUDC|nr:hypothetical protein NDAI_0E04020 [Naumovozyma dairenensis CBS 421]CCD25219.1 hypothetical protein NDAI_0E04020 [Naumovozyma dairenensis CBS 421]